MLTREDCVEIECALRSKIVSLERGELGPEDEPGATKKWIAHLEAITHKIGPDGGDLFELLKELERLRDLEARQ